MGARDLLNILRHSPESQLRPDITRALNTFLDQEPSESACATALEEIAALPETLASRFVKAIAKPPSMPE